MKMLFSRQGSVARIFYLPFEIILKIWLFAGTSLLFGLFKIEEIIARISSFSAEPVKVNLEPQAWHKRHPSLNYFFFITFIVLSLFVVIRLIYVILVVVFCLMYQGLSSIRSSLKLAKVPEAIWEYNWKWAIEKVEFVWQQIVMSF